MPPVEDRAAWHELCQEEATTPWRFNLEFRASGLILAASFSVLAACGGDGDEVRGSAHAPTSSSFSIALAADKAVNL